MDREGEAIAWHLKEVIGGDDSRYQRVVFNEITKMPSKMHSSIQHALISIKLMRNKHAAFRSCCWLYDFALTLGKIARGLSAGRVQSVAVKLVVEREREIRAFIPEEYWQVLQTPSHRPMRFV